MVTSYMQPKNIVCDVAILGAGLAGLTLALQLRKQLPQASIAIIERHTFPVLESAHKVGESTVEIAAHYFSNTLGLTEHLQNSQLPKLGLRCFFSGGQGVPLKERVEFGSNSFFPRNTYQIDRGRFENYLASLVVERNVEIFEGAYVRGIQLREQDLHQVNFDVGTESINCKAKWVIDASGRAGILRKNKNLTLQCDHKVNAAWFRIAGKFDINTWVAADSWRVNNLDRKSRWFSTNHLMGEGYWVWIIPVASGATSFGIVADPRYHALEEFNSFEKAQDWLAKHEPECAAAIAGHSANLQDFLALKNFSRRTSQVFCNERWAISGDAGVFIDPLYSPGSDYIAFSNTYICELVSRELRGKPVRELARIYNDLLLSFTENTFLVYQDQYQLLGNSTVMPLKILWDFATYWSFFAFLFVNDKLLDLELYLKIESELKWLQKVNSEMQCLLRQADQLGRPTVEQRMIDLADYPWFIELNRDLVSRAADGEFGRILSAKLRELASFGVEVYQQLQRSYPGLPAPAFAEGVEPTAHISAW